MAGKSREKYEQSERPYYVDLLCLETGLDERGLYPGEPDESEATDTE